MIKILADSHIPFLQEYFGNSSKLILKSGRHITPAEVKEMDILLVRSITPVNAALLNGSQVKFVGSVTAGDDHLDKIWLKKKNIAYSVAQGFNAPPVADYVISVIAALQNRQILIHKKMKAAVIGVGNVGKLVAERLKMLNFEVICCDPYRAQYEKNFQTTALHEISDCDLVTLHVPLTRSGEFPTYHFINEQFLENQNNNMILINASRGAVLDQEILIKNEKAHLYCLDVWENEPHINKVLLRKAFIATPHIAGYSVQSKIRGINMIYERACLEQVIERLEVPPIIMPIQHLALHHENQLSWQDVVLQVFDPLKMTEIMQNTLLSSDSYGHLFDELRNHFNYRYEFAYTLLQESAVKKEDRMILKKLGFRLV